MESIGRSCGITLSDGSGCSGLVATDAALNLCEHHLLDAADLAARKVGVTDVLPSPCLACGSRLGVSYPSGWLCAICEWRHGESPDGEFPPPRLDVVYYIRFGELIKIGTSANPRRRIASLPHDEVLAFERGDRRLEQRRHAQFASQQVNGGEWFHTHDALLQHIDIVRGGIDPWDAHARWLSALLALRG
ncbi:GIY-YIG nuclease family protein [Orlajensenia leifsoniae]|uniref:GIY-YIG nuclease family protein n=1 Tax=Orlajensenia leifsoniae TaxID=2561933 RepID=A0A4Y9R4M9_9MICO|nr:GIY-YIG nuclease family protein [Leifsonia flava]TFV99068.1 GIY-YIG nuclease family protein [Leifsonia flava]